MPDEPVAPRSGDGGLVRLPVVRLRLDVAYDGAEFAGWARQGDRRTVQDVLERALGTVLRVPAPSTTCAGRTDAGVHARGQVVHVDVPRSAYDAVKDVLPRRLSGVLPADLVLRRLAVAPEGFDARFAPLWRRYAYRLSDAVYGPDPLLRRSVLHVIRPLDVNRMNEASRALVGEHDFAAFCRRRQGASTVRTLLELSWQRVADDLVEGRVVADAFCHNMVRALVGALVAVGDGRRPVDWPAEVLRARVRPPDVQVVPPHGLTLEEVRYPPEKELAAQVGRTRRRRDAT